MSFRGKTGRRGPAQAGHDHKLEQLCSQVFEVVSSAFAELRDEVLANLTVVEVRPGPDASRLVVLLTQMGEPQAGTGVDDIMVRLERVRGFLRSEVASAIHRKRTPELRFQLVANQPL